MNCKFPIKATYGFIRRRRHPRMPPLQIITTGNLYMPTRLMSSPAFISNEPNEPLFDNLRTTYAHTTVWDDPPGTRRLPSLTSRCYGPEGMLICNFRWFLADRCHQGRKDSVTHTNLVNALYTYFRFRMQISGKFGFDRTHAYE